MKRTIQIAPKQLRALMVLMLILHVFRVYLTGGFKRPRELIGYTEFRTNLPSGRHANVITMRAAMVRADVDLIAEIRHVYDNYGYETEILAASVRHTMHVIDCAKIGADVMTGPLSSIKGLIKHPLTDSGLEKFLADFKKGN